MLYVGLAISGIGVVLYAVSAILLNYYLRKNRPDVLEQFDSKSGDSRNKQKGNKGRQVRVVVTDSATPGWVALLGFPAIPLFLIGIAVIILSLVINAFS
ncbi:hypothetical protein ACFL6S_12365 [Candidatus Poribacteria bacterium]